MSLRYLVIGLEQRERRWCASHHEVAQVLRQTVDKEQRVEALVAYLLVDEQRLWHVASEERLVETEVVVIVEHVEVVDGILIGDVAIARSEHLVKDRQRVAHCAIGLLRYHIECRGVGSNALVLADVLQLLHDVGHRDARKVIDLASRQDGGDNLLLLGGGEDEDGILGWFLQSLEEGIESGL